MPDLTGDAEGSRAAKIALRSHLITARRALTPADRSTAALRLQDQILALVRREHPSTIAAYVPVGSEPGGPDLPLVLAAHARVLLPILLPDGDLDWAAFTAPTGSADFTGATSATSSTACTGSMGSPASTGSTASTGSSAFTGPGVLVGLADGPRGLREPVGARLGVDAIAAADLILVPALAVDRRGVRMGRGGGSYDRVLARLPFPAPPLIMALLHEGELVDEVPAEPHDRRVHGIVTPRGVITLNPAREWTK